MKGGMKTLKRTMVLPVLAVLMVLFMQACERKPLYLRISRAGIEISIDLKLELFWGLEWKAEWQYDWKTEYSQFGRIGYAKPEWVRATIYSVDTVSDAKTRLFTQNFTSKGGKVSLTPGETYKVLFYNAGTEYTIFNTDESNTFYSATTRVGDTRVLSRTRSDESQPEPRHYVDYKQPDELIGVMTDRLFISESPDDYEKTVDEDGNITYIYRISARLEPYSFIYLFQVMLINNYDSIGQRVKSGTTMTVTGLAQGVDLFTRKTWDNSISISLDDLKPMQNKVELVLPDSTRTVGDIYATRMLTWGLPGMKPLEAAQQAGDSIVYLDDNWVNIGLKLRNGAEYVISYDITDQMRKKPAGGVITIVIDALNQIPDKELEKKEPKGGGGFNADVDPWTNEYDAEITV